MATGGGLLQAIAMDMNQRGRRRSSRVDGQQSGSAGPGLDSLGLACESDTALVERARSGERLAFGLLYLRHQDAAWRMANAVSGFSSDADEVVVEAFARLLTSAPGGLADAASLRSDLLGCVRRVALAQGSAEHRGAGVPAATEQGSSPSRNETSLVEVEPTVAAALRGLDEPERTALWLTEVEALTPHEIGAVMELQPEEAAALAGRGRLELRLGLANIFAVEGTRSCRLAALHTATAGEIEPPAHPGLATHVRRCLVCRMRRAEAADVAAALRSVIPPSPLLGRPSQRRWRRRGQTSRRVLFMTRPLLAAPAALLIVLLVGTWWVLRR
jgi:DNA-directed RNA polymerase specialized sigma24 family protein